MSLLRGDLGLSGRLFMSVPVSSRLFAATSDGKILFSGGHWDNSIRAYALDPESNYHQVISVHKGLVTCLSLTSDCRFLVTGSEDTTLRVFDIVTADQQSAKARTKTFSSPRAPNSPSIDPRHVLYGHHDHVTSVVASSELNVVVSGSLGVCMVHDLRKGEYVRTINLLHKDDYVDKIGLDNMQGIIVVFCKPSLTVHVFSINGTLIVSEETERIADMIVTPDGKYIITGGNRKIVTVRNVHDLRVVAKIKVESPIFSLAMAGSRHVLIGVDVGFLVLHSKAFIPHSSSQSQDSGKATVLGYSHIL